MWLVYGLLVVLPASYLVGHTRAGEFSPFFLACLTYEDREGDSRTLIRPRIRDNLAQYVCHSYTVNRKNGNNHTQTIR